MAKQFDWQTAKGARGINRPSWKIEAIKATGFSAGLPQTFYARVDTLDTAKADLFASGDYGHLYIYSPGKCYCPKCNETHACRDCWTLVSEVLPRSLVEASV